MIERESSSNGSGGDSSERRRFHRINLDAQVHLYSGSQAWRSELIDISLKGALLKRPDEWSGKPGDFYRIEIRLEGGVVISMSVGVAHISEDRIGFICQRIDMDSFVHLKRLVELNLGDATLLTRELSGLG
ncbi:MAG: PilZ domain-containing protein [Pseudomonadota bacterium]